eukprot:11199070-Lingulodinium_polyedra.AAC.1
MQTWRGRVAPRRQPRISGPDRAKRERPTAVAQPGGRWPASGAGGRRGRPPRKNARLANADG